MRVAGQLSEWIYSLLWRAIESRFGVEHESPQVIVLRKGQVCWDASHFKITAEAVAKAVREAGEAV